MKRSIISICCTAILLSLNAFAQDPGFRPPESRPTAAPQAANNSGGAGIVSGASTLASMDRLDDRQPIGPNYTISIRVLEDRKDAVQQKVAITGEVQVPYVGLVRAEGKTCRQLALDVKRELEKSFFITATVLISIDARPDTDKYDVTEIETYTVFGFVLRQGKYDIPKTEDVTISQAILRAGGFAAFADNRHVKVVRHTPNGDKNILVDVDSIMSKGQMHKDIYLRKNDVLIIPEKKVNF